MGRRFGYGLLPFKIILEFGALFLLAVHHRAAVNGGLEKKVAHVRPNLGVFADDFGDDVPGAGHGVLGVFHAFFRVHMIGGQSKGIYRFVLLQQRHGQGLQALFPGDGGFCPALGLVRQVDVLQFGHGLGGHHLLLEFVSEMAVFFQGTQDGFTAVVNGGQLGQPVPDCRDLHFVQAAGGFLAIPGNKRNGGAFMQQQGCGLHRLGGYGKFFRNDDYMLWVHSKSLSKNWVGLRFREAFHSTMGRGGQCL